jgi:NAD(P)-dependent dehydrogenase (short-subunit alcohol dehydrogenase family)
MGIDRTAIVTGAGKRVGRAIAEALLSDGWTVVAHVHHDDDGVPDGAIKVATDLARPDCADPIFAACTGQAPASLLVNNAARFAHDSFGAFSAAEFEAHMTINARAPIMLSEAFAAQHRGGDGLIVNLLDSKLAAPNPDFLSYTLSKQALAGATELMARHYASQQIRANAIAPALMLRSGDQSVANFEAMHRHNPLRLGVTPEDVVAALRFLIAAPAVTGQTILIDGGQRFLGLGRDVQFLDPETLE